MSLARYLSKLWAMLGSDGKVPSAALAAGAARANFGAGAVLQVVSATVNYGMSTTSTTITDTGLQAVITPSSATSKIFVIAGYAASVNSSGGNNVQALFDIARNGTAIVGVTAPRIYSYGSANYTNNLQCLSKLDSPNSTSALTYKLRFAKGDGPGSVYVSGDGGDATLTLMEIAG